MSELGDRAVALADRLEDLAGRNERGGIIPHTDLAACSIEARAIANAAQTPDGVFTTHELNAEVQPEGLTEEAQPGEETEPAAAGTEPSEVEEPGTAQEPAVEPDVVPGQEPPAVEPAADVPTYSDNPVENPPQPENPAAE